MCSDWLIDIGHLSSSQKTITSSNTITRPRASAQSVICQNKYGNEHEINPLAIQKSVCMKEIVDFVTNSEVARE